MTRWQDPALQERLAELSARGMSAAQIAAEIGETRDAVKSAMTRYGLFASSGRRRIGSGRSGVKENGNFY
jgi:hypothetical protein